MILVDTSVWIDHFRAASPDLVRLLEQGRVLVHPFVVGELALGNLRDRTTVLGALKQMPQAVRAHDDEVLSFIEANRLHGLGVGYIDAHLLASARLTTGARFWTRDRRLNAVSEQLSVAFHPQG
ncbi:MAG: VapC toxin family PIN domain ribonuclease [Caulobacter sp. 12-67-6]|nr:MAG: VapC toxin family PIN domain ribonuclease [Caulobacter sp. 12-67-6]OYX69382.1 MAG: VapC toxin family PIN domain ribonuclease [Caulobacter sp. 32-67-35]HQR88222.1 type II toxin-antitoxin system VapC family toxin [Caulobacter sp.]